MPEDLLAAQTRTTPPPPPGLVAERFRLDQALGEGAMSVVYRALDNMSGQRVAVIVEADECGFPEKRVLEIE